MSVPDRMRIQIMEAIRDWIAAQHLTQGQAAERLGLYKQQVSEIVNLKSRYSFTRLLQAWQASGGEYHFTAFRTDHHL